MVELALSFRGYRQFSALDTGGCLGRFTKPYRAMIVFHHHQQQRKVREDIRDIRGNFSRIALAYGTELESTAECSDLKNTCVLPDENIITVGAKRARFLGVLFQQVFIVKKLATSRTPLSRASCN